jgi:hypothetical protein
MKRHRLQCGLDRWTVYDIWTDQPCTTATLWRGPEDGLNGRSAPNRLVRVQGR